MAIEVDYRFPPGVDAERQAKAIAVGQTAGSWDERFAHRERSLRGRLGEVVRVIPLIPGGALATVRFPEGNVEGDVPTLLTMIFGKYSMAGPAKVMDVRLPHGYGVPPKLGSAGIRARLGVPGRPLLMAIFKPALGLSADDHAVLLEEVAGAGLDIIKDDEILGDLPEAPTLERTHKCRRVLEDLQAKTGRTMLYAVNATGRRGAMPVRARRLVRGGANALLVNTLAYGFGELEALAADASIEVPLFVHPALAGAWCAAPDHGFAWPVVLGTLMAAAGADAVLYPAHYGSLPFAAADEAAIRDRLRARGVMPVPSAGIHPGVVPRLLADYGNDVILNAGTGIMEHPDGPAAGVCAFREALDRTLEKSQGQAPPGRPFTPAEVPGGPLRRALDKWGWG